jgi:hypothetical protein
VIGALVAFLSIGPPFDETANLCDRSRPALAHSRSELLFDQASEHARVASDEIGEIPDSGKPVELQDPCEPLPELSPRAALDAPARPERVAHRPSSFAAQRPETCLLSLAQSSD